MFVCYEDLELYRLSRVLIFIEEFVYFDEF